MPSTYRGPAIIQGPAHLVVCQQNIMFYNRASNRTDVPKRKGPRPSQNPKHEEIRASSSCSHTGSSHCSNIQNYDFSKCSGHGASRKRGHNVSLTTHEQPLMSLMVKRLGMQQFEEPESIPVPTAALTALSPSILIDTRPAPSVYISTTHVVSSSCASRTAVPVFAAGVAPLLLLWPYLDIQHE
jgi:hypothetical protein